MARRGAVVALASMTPDEYPNGVSAERVERRLSEECGRLRVDVAELRGEMRADMAGLRVEMVKGNTALLKWLLLFFVSQTAALAAIFRVFVN